MNRVTINRMSCILLVLLFIPWLLYAQPNDPIVKVFIVKEGKLTVYLPHLSPSITISGTVLAEPSGNSEKEKNRNKELLDNYSLVINQKALPVSEKIFTQQTPNTTTPLILELKNNRGETIKKEEVPFENSAIQPTGNMSLPYFVAGQPTRLTGAFDGNLTNTTVKINEVKAELLAEAPGQLYFKPPADINGNVKMECTENGNSRVTSCNALRLEMSADKLNLLRGEKTILHIKVSGLEGVKETIPLSIVNQSPSTVSMEGGNTQQISISSAMHGSTGIYETNRAIQSLKNGSFTIAANIESPSTSTGSAALLCNCFIEYRTYLLPPRTCNELGGSCGSAMPAQPEGVTTANPGLPAVVTISVPEKMDTTTGKITLRVNDLKNDVAAVVFAEKPAGNEQWRQVGAASQKENSWQYDWTVPLGNDGIHNIRARVVSKDNTVSEKFTQTTLSLSPLALSPGRNERINLSVSEAEVKQAEQKAKQTSDQLKESGEKITELEKKQEEFEQQAEEKREMVNELVTIDETLEKIPALFGDSLKVLADSLKKLQGNSPTPPKPDDLKQDADEAAQRQKDCEDRLAKLKQEKADLEKQRDDLKAQQDALLNQMDQLHLANGWIGRHGYHSDGLLWYGYVGDENSNTGIDGQARALDKQMRPLNKAYRNALKRLKNLDNEIADAEKDCEKLKKEAEEAALAAKNANQAQAVEGKIDELNRQIQSLLDALRDWCAAHPGICNFENDLAALQGGDLQPGAINDFLDKIDGLIAKKQQLEKDLENSATEDAAKADSTAADIEKEKENATGLAEEQKKQQAEADRLRGEREKQLEAEREKQRKKEEEDRIKKNTISPQPSLPVPVNPEDDQLKFQAQRLFRSLYQKYLIEKGRCDCRTKAIALANNSNTIVSDIIGRLGVGVAFAPLEAFPGFSFGARLGIGAAKALGSALFGGQDFSEELAKNLFNVIGGEIFPQLTGDDFTGNKVNELASGGLEAIFKAEGIRTISWEGETELRQCGIVKGKTVILFNPNTGWVSIMIKIENCPLVVIKYKVNKDGVPVSTPSVHVVTG